MFERASIFLAEDSPADVYLFREALKAHGVDCDLLVFDDGQAAMSFLVGAEKDGSGPDIFVLDLNLPRKTGLEVLEWTRQQPALKRLVVILFTSSCLPADIDRAYDLGANSFIQKPADLADALEMAQLLKGWWLGYNHFAVV